VIERSITFVMVKRNRLAWFVHRTRFRRKAHMMKSLFTMLGVLALLGTATHTSAACRRFGTQLECDLGDRELVIGTQVEAQPGYARAFHPNLLTSGTDVFDDRAAAPLRLELQNVGTDPGLCWKLGNETHCH
jgi:hypothetical protein